MGEKFTVNGVPIDEIAQSVLWLLRDADGERSASQLAEDLTADTDKVRYRFKNLRKAGLVNLERTEKQQPGAQNPTKYHTINETGLEWLYEHQEDAETAVGRKRYIDSLDRVREIAMDAKETTRTLEDDVDELEEEFSTDLADCVADLQADINELRSDLESERRGQNNQIQNVEEELDRLDQLEARVDILEERLDNVDLESLPDRMAALEDEFERRDNELDELWRRVRYNAREQVDLNFWKLLFGGPDPRVPGQDELPYREKYR
jgi:predicted ArsR family transcriptional regulator